LARPKADVGNFRWGPKPDISGAALRCRAAPRRAARNSEIDLLGKFERVIEFHAQIVSSFVSPSRSRQARRLPVRL
jgi:hypothetical protein